MRTQPLDGIRVLDLSSVVVGPATSLRLAQYGAEVIKVEAPGGDLMRTLGGESPTGQHSGAYLHFNRGKRAMALDLKQPQAQQAVHAMIPKFDVVLTNMRPAALERLQLDAARLRAINPNLIHCSITGFGPGGRYRSLPAYDSVLQGVSGIAGLHDRRDGKAAYAPLLICDHVVGEIAAGAVMAALLDRASNGEGSTIEVPMFETMAAFVLQEHLARASFDPPLGPSGDKRLMDPGARPVRTADGWISLTTNTDAQFGAFMRAIGRPECIVDPRFASVADRMRNLDQWFAIRDAELIRHPTAHWLKVFGEADVPAMPCHSLETLQEDPHLDDVCLIESDIHPTEGKVVALRPTILRDGEPGPTGQSAQPLGWETRDILIDMGLDSALVDELIERGAAIQHPGVAAKDETPHA
tara:strand:- start:10919 stop:12154 length:1236 start_codon:yes stop_codon:yes gene_type:complete